MRFLLRSLLLGALIFVGDRAIGPKAPSLPPDPAESAVGDGEEAALVRQASALGLAHTDPVIQQRLRQNLRFVGGASPAAIAQMRANDPVVRRRLAQRMRFILEESVEPAVPDDDEIATRYRANVDRFTRPTQLRLSHVFFAADRGDATERAQRTRRSLIDAHAEGPTLALLGDAFPEGAQLPLQSLAQLRRRFGSDFTAAVADLPDRRWSAPLRSAYGLHLVWVEERRSAEVRPLPEVRDAIRAEAIASARRRAVSEAIDGTR